MARRPIAAALTVTLALGFGLGACGSDDSDTKANPQGPGQSSKEDPTLTDDRGGESTTDGADEGTPANSGATSGSTSDSSGVPGDAP
jgi:hypothetical protein